MRFGLALLPALLVSVFVACASESSPAPPATDDDDRDAGRRPNGTGITPVEPAKPFPERDSGQGDDDDDDDDPGEEDPPPGGDTETEPNNGGTATEVNALPIPGAISGTIDPANDVDVFGVNPAAGELWEWKLVPKGELAPHLIIFDTTPNNLNPNVLATGASGASVTLEHFVIGAGKFAAVVRDARNVPTASGKGGPAFGYTLTATKKTLQPTSVTFPSKKTGTLASLSSVQLYGFTATEGMRFDIIVRAGRKAAPSTLDSRLSLFNATTRKNVATNDDVSGTITDSELGGTLPAGEYIVVLENEGTNAADLSYEIEFALRR